MKNCYNIDTAIIYGDLPPATKLFEAAKFNDTKNSFNVLIATDAIGMGLNLNIKRFLKFTINKNNNNMLELFFLL